MLKNINNYIWKTINEATSLTTKDIINKDYSGKELVNMEAGLSLLVTFLEGVRVTKQNLNEEKLEEDLKKIKELKSFIMTAEELNHRIVSYMAR